MGTTGDGLGRYQNGRLSFLLKKEGLVNDYVTALFEDGFPGRTIDRWMPTFIATRAVRPRD